MRSPTVDERILTTPCLQYWTLAVRHNGRFVGEFTSLVRGEVIEQMSKWKRQGFRRADLKIVASNPGEDAIDKAVSALNEPRLAARLE
jgi:hypothetical protein